MTAPPGTGRFQMKFIQDGTGGWDPTFAAAVLWPGGNAPNFTNQAGSEDIVTFYFDGTNYYAVEALNFS